MVSKLTKKNKKQIETCFCKVYKVNFVPQIN